MKNYIVDSHCHLDLIEKQGADIDQVIANSLENNVKLLQTICTRISQIDNILSYTKQHDFIYASVGIHPCNVDEEPEICAQDIMHLCQQHDKIIGIGETGLDYYHDQSFITKQKKSFIEHIKAAQETGLPLIIHSRDADMDMMQILEEQFQIKPFYALLHCFSSSKELAQRALKLGMYISISGIVTFKNAKELQDIVSELPLDKLLVETDSPYLAPTPHRGKTNEPAYTRHVVEFIAQLRGITVQALTEQTTANFLRLFTKVPA